MKKSKVGKVVTVKLRVLEESPNTTVFRASRTSTGWSGLPRSCPRRDSRGLTKTCRYDRV